MELLLIFLLFVTTGEVTPIVSVSIILRTFSNISSALQCLAVAYRATSPGPVVWWMGKRLLRTAGRGR